MQGLQCPKRTMEVNLNRIRVERGMSNAEGKKRIQGGFERMAGQHENKDKRAEIQQNVHYGQEAVYGSYCRIIVQLSYLGNERR